MPSVWEGPAPFGLHPGLSPAHRHSARHQTGLGNDLFLPLPDGAGKKEGPETGKVIELRSKLPLPGALAGPKLTIQVTHQAGAASY